MPPNRVSISHLLIFDTVSVGTFVLIWYLQGFVLSSVMFYVAWILNTIAFMILQYLAVPEESEHMDWVFLIGLALVLIVGMLTEIMPWPLLIFVTGLGALSLTVHRSTLNRLWDDEEKSDVMSDIPRNWSIGILTGILILALVLRLWKLGEVSFWWDELLHVATAHESSFEWVPTHPSGQEYFRNFLTSYMVYAVDAVGPLKEWTARLPMAIISLGIVGLGYRLGVHFKNRITGLLSAFLIAVYPPIIVFSQEVRYYVPLSLFILGFFLVLRSSLSWWYKAPLLLGLLWLGENISLLMLAVAGVLWIGHIILEFFHTPNKREALRTYGVPVGLVFVSGGIFVIRKFQRLASSNFFKDELFVLRENFISFPNATLLVLILVTLLGAIWSVRKISYRARSMGILAFSLIVFFTLISTVNTKFSAAEPGFRYINFVLPFLMALVATGGYVFWRIYRKEVRVLYVFLLGMAFVLPFGDYVTGNGHFELKQQFTGVRPDFRGWGELDMPENAVKVALFPHTAYLYVGEIDYALRKEGQGGFDPSVTRNDPVMGTYVLTELHHAGLTERCTYVFTDHREDTVWNDPLRADIRRYFDRQTLAPNTYVYVANACNKNSDG